MRSQTARALAFILVGALTSGCDKGLSPGPVAAPEEFHPGFGGVVRYISTWPPRDSVQALWVAAVRSLPADSSIGSFFTLYLNKGVLLSDTLSRFDDSGSVRQYALRDIPPGSYNYVAVIRQYGATPYELDVIGIYGMRPGHLLSLPVDVPSEAFIDSIDIVVDFANLPPQPFKP